jgi:hypothetical protein
MRYLEIIVIIIILFMFSFHPSVALPHTIGIAHHKISITCSITSSLIGAWIFLDGKNTSQKVPGNVDINKPGEHNITLISKDISVSQKVLINESLNEIRLDPNNGKANMSLIFEKS